MGKYKQGDPLYDALYDMACFMGNGALGRLEKLLLDAPDEWAGIKLYDAVTDVIAVRADKGVLKD